MSPVIRLRIERVFWLAGLCLIGYCVFLGLRAQAYNDASQNTQATSLFHSGATPKVKATAQEPIIGHLDIPALSLSVAVLSDFESSSLLKGVGHIQGTAVPGGLGTVGLVGHRDTFFRPLRHIATDMEIRLSDVTGIYRYSVDSTEIVTPDQVSVLDITNRPGMVLVTCYPFDFVGAAPKRFIVHAHLLSLTPEVSPKS